MYSAVESPGREGAVKCDLEERRVQFSVIKRKEVCIEVFYRGRECAVQGDLDKGKVQCSVV